MDHSDPYDHVINTNQPMKEKDHMELVLDAQLWRIEELYGVDIDQ